MRALIAIACSGCSSLLGISDPTPATEGDGGIDAMVDSHIDAAPPCAPAIKLKPEVTTEVGKAGMDLVIGRFNNGLDEDIAIATGADITILYGNRTGAFANADTLATAAVGIAQADFDGIGFDDLVAWTPSTVVVHIANRTVDPPFDAAKSLVGPFTNVQRVIAGELSGAPRSDVIVYDAAEGSRVHESNAAGATNPFTRQSTVVGTAADELVALAQIDQESRTDAIFVNGADVKLSLLTNSFGALQTVAMGGRGIAIGRFDTDGLPDIVVSTANGLVLYRQNPASPGTFAMHGVISPLTATAPLLVGDVNDDGRDDIVLPNAAILQCAPVAGGVGVFSQVEAIDAAAPADFVDVTGDAKRDLVRLDGTAIKVRAL